MLPLLSLLLAACPRPAPEAPVAVAAPAPAPTVTGWHCTAWVSRATEATPFTVEGDGTTEAEADAAAWEHACAQLPPTDPPGGCKVEAPPDGWSWSRTPTLGGTAEAPTAHVVLTLSPEPVPYQGVAETTTSQDEACGAAYTRACEAAGAQPGCERDPEFVDGGVAAVEADLAAEVGTAAPQ